MTLTTLLTLAGLIAAYSAGYLVGRQRCERWEAEQRDALWVEAVEHGRAVERRLTWSGLWTHGRVTNEQTRPRA